MRRRVGHVTVILITAHNGPEQEESACIVLKKKLQPGQGEGLAQGQIQVHETPNDFWATTQPPLHTSLSLFLSSSQAFCPQHPRPFIHDEGH